MRFCFQNLQKFLGAVSGQEQATGLLSKKVSFYMIFPLRCNCVHHWWKLGNLEKPVRLNLAFHQLPPLALREIWRQELREASAQQCAAPTEMERFLEFQNLIPSDEGDSKTSLVVRPGL